jgi:hypothetical protein
VTSNGVANLQPFQKGDPRASEAGRRGAAAKRAKREIERASSQETSAHIATLVTTYTREDLGPAAAAAAVELIGRVSRGEIPVRHAGDAAELVKVLVDVARLEAGESTSNAVVAHVTSDQLARVRALQEQARTATEVVEVAIPPVAVDGLDETRTPTPG